MSDGRKNNGGNKNAGRKSKAVEQQLFDKLSIYEDEAQAALKTCVLDKQSWAVKMYFEYMYGKPKERIDHTTNGNDINASQIEFFNSEDKR